MERPSSEGGPLRTGDCNAAHAGAVGDPFLRDREAVDACVFEGYGTTDAEGEGAGRAVREPQRADA